MRKRLRLVIALPLIAACTASEPGRLPTVGPSAAVRSPGAEQDERLQALVEELARPPFGTGAVLSISVGGRTFSYAAGTLWEGGPAAAADSRFNWASVSKLLTVARVVALAHEGRVDLEDPVGKHLPGVVLPDAGGTNRASEITLRQLLMHRGGLPHQPSELDPRRVDSDWGDPELLRKLTSSWSVTLVREPGTYGYSNVGYALLAAVVERVEGKPFAEAMEPFLRGLGMRDSTFSPGNLTERAAHGRVEQHGAVAFHEPGWYASRYALPFTGLWATTADMVRFGQALIDAAADAEAPLHPMSALDTLTGHGLGPVHRERFGARSLEHDGGGPGFLAWFLTIPERDASLAIVCNGDGESREKSKRLFELTNEMLSLVLDDAASR